MAEIKPKIRYELKYSTQVCGAILLLVEEYVLKLSEDLTLAERLKKQNPKLLIFKLAERIIKKEGAFKDISETLKKELHMHQKDAEKLAIDIKDKIVPLADIIIPEEDELEKESSTQEIILKKIRGDSLEKEVLEKEVPSLPGVKKIQIANVEENAEDLKKARTLTQQEEEKGGPDSYREPIE